MAAAAVKKSTTSLSLFMEAFGLAVDEDLSTLATSSIGQRESGRESGIRSNKKLG